PGRVTGAPEAVVNPPSGPVDRAGAPVELVVDEVLEPLAAAVSVVIPAYNEAAHVADQIRRVEAVLATTGWQYEILVVDDGSTDATAANAATAAVPASPAAAAAVSRAPAGTAAGDDGGDDGGGDGGDDGSGDGGGPGGPGARAGAAAPGRVRVVRRAQNRGYGAALKLGVRLARYDWILITDADGTYPAEAIPALLAHGAAHSMVVGARTGTTVRVPLERRPAKWFLNRLASYLAGQPLPDLNSGLRLMRKALVERYAHLLPEGFSFTTTITLAAACNGHPVAYVPIDYHARLGASKIRPRHAYDFTLLIIRTIVFFHPLKVFLPLGAVLAAGGLAKFTYDLFRDNLSESAVLGVLGALIVWAVGLLADQNTRLAPPRR
ncbi:MAG TPA: glycosyltransferase family 2 protein, partial [Vicinamibacteria bacterium]|nr:glycosyltransferase family 2 protein [Vicinamibacteria bacterium]